MRFKERMKKLKTGVVEFTKKRGGHIALFVCLCVIGAAAGIIFSNAPEPEDAPQEDVEAVSGVRDESLQDALNPTPPPEFRIDSQEEPVSGIHAAPLGVSTPEPTSIEDFTQSPPSTPRPGSEDLLPPPVSGGIIWDFALDELIYSVTLDQWMTHTGVDIACKTGDTVRAVNSGVVERVYEDDELGWTVIISHGNGHTSVYSGLSEDIDVAEGDSLDKNVPVGKCGDSAVSECALQPHIHFEYHIDGVPVNPADFVLFTD